MGRVEARGIAALPGHRGRRRLDPPDSRRRERLAGRKGQPLASYYSRDVTSPQQAYLYALDAEQRLPAAQLRRAEGLGGQPGGAGAGLSGVPWPYRAADCRSRQVAPGGTRGDSRRAGLGRCPRTECLRGTRFNRGDVLWEIGDIESVWITADLFPEDLRSVSGARTATVILPGGSELHATVDSSLPRFESAARVAKLRLIGEQPQSQLAARNDGHGRRCRAPRSKV